MQLLKKIIGYLLKIAISVAIIWYLLHRSGASATDFQMLAPKWLLLCAFFLLLQYFMTAVRWFCLMRCIGIRLPFFQALSLMMQGYFFTLFIPAGSVSGDIVKGGLLVARTEGEARFNGVFSIIADRLCGFVGLLLAVLTALPFYSREIMAGPKSFQLTVLIMVCACVLGITLVLCLFSYSFFFRFKGFKKFWDWSDRHTKGAFTKMANVINLYRAKWKLLLFWTLVSGFLMFPMQSLAFWCISKTAIACGGHLFAAALLAGLLGELSGILPITPGGIGTRDAAAAAVFQIFGLPAGASTVVTTTFTVIFIIVSALGAVFMVMDSVRGRKLSAPDSKK